MDIHTATEVAYKNGYAKGKADAAMEIIAEIDNRLHDMAMEYAKADRKDCFCVCEMVHHRVIRPVEKKYTEGR